VDNAAQGLRAAASPPTNSNAVSKHRIAAGPCGLVRRCAICSPIREPLAFKSA